MSAVLISFSGHKLSNEALDKLKEEYEIIEEVFVPYIDFEQDIESQLESVANQVKFKLDGSRTITLIIPGHSTLSALLYVFIYGIIGHPPDLLLLQEDDSGNYLPYKKYKGREIKKTGRLLREKLLKRND